MPVMDGWEFLRRKNGDPRIASVPVVVLSAIPPESLEGAEAVLSKPVDPRRLIATVEHYVRTSVSNIGDAQRNARGAHHR